MEVKDQEIYSDTFFNKLDLLSLTFEWKDLHGKNLKIHYYDVTDGICVWGEDLENKKFYLLNFKLK